MQYDLKYPVHTGWAKKRMFLGVGNIAIVVWWEEKVWDDVAGLLKRNTMATSQLVTQSSHHMDISSHG